MTLEQQLQQFADDYPEQREEANSFRQLLDGAHDAFVRERLEGHFTASGWLVNPSGDKVLLTHHRKLNRWLQLGGHADGERDLRIAALKEAEEESGLTHLRVLPEIFDIDLHTIPARGNEPEHQHFDVRYVIVAEGELTPQLSEESIDLRWCSIQELIDAPNTDTSMKRMARRWQARSGH